MRIREMLNSRTWRRIRICLELVGALGVSGACFPFWMDRLRIFRTTIALTEAEEKFREESERKRSEERRKIASYNREIAEQQQAEPFRYQGPELSDPVYESLLNEGDAQGTMGYLQIPSIEVSLPIAHGTSDEVLQHAVGHLYGTSLPSGGADTHAVLAGHTGLVSDRLLTDLDKMREGDTFSIRVMNEEHEYRVDRIVVCLPEECDSYLQIEPDKDYVTLYTCTPCGINDRRLLVRGERVAEPLTDKLPEQKDAADSEEDRKWKAFAANGGDKAAAWLAVWTGLMGMPWAQMLSRHSYLKKRRKSQGG